MNVQGGLFIHLDDELVLGRNPVREALKAGSGVRRIFVARGAKGPQIDDIVKEARTKQIPVRMVERSELDRIAGSRGFVKHQGVAAFADPPKYTDLASILEKAVGGARAPLVIVLDGVEDPMNLGSIVRTSEAAGANGVIIPQRRAAGITPAVVRASAGATEHMPVARVPNIVSAIREMKSAGFWIAGLDVTGGSLWRADLTVPLAIVVGGEGKGLGRLVRETCDFLIGIPMAGRIGSLNAGVAAALAIFETLRQRLTPLLPQNKR